MPHRLNLLDTSGKYCNKNFPRERLNSNTENDGVFFPFTGGITLCSLQYYNFDFEKGIFKMAGVPSMYLVNQEILQKPFCLVLPY